MDLIILYYSRVCVHLCFLVSPLSYMHCSSCSDELSVCLSYLPVCLAGWLAYWRVITSYQVLKRRIRRIEAAGTGYSHYIHHSIVKTTTTSTTTAAADGSNYNTQSLTMSICLPACPSVHSDTYYNQI